MEIENLLKQSLKLYLKNFHKLILPWTIVIFAKIFRAPFVITFIAEIFAYIYFLKISYDILFPNREPLSWTIIKTRLWRFIIMSLYSSCKVFIGLLLFIIPGIRWFFELYFVHYIALFCTKTTNPVELSKALFNFDRQLLINACILSSILILCNLKLNNILGIYFNESSYLKFHILSTIYSTVISAYILFIFIFTFSILLKGYESDTYKQPLEVYNFTYRKLLSFLGTILLAIAIFLFMILCIIIVMLYVITEPTGGIKQPFFEFFFGFVKAFPEVLYNLYKGYQSYK